MASGWPDQIWAPWQDNADPMTGMADFNKPKDPRVQYGISKGLPSDWRDTYKQTVGRSNAWDVVGTADVAGNALFAAAADAIGLDWDEWRAETMAAIGNQDEYVAEALRDSSRQSSSDSPVRGSSAYYISRFSNRGYNPPTNRPGGGSTEDISTASREEMDLADLWGLGNQHNQIKKDLNEMQEWLEGVNKKAAERQADIIGDGPQASDYNMEGNLYEILGLTEAPDAPKELAVSWESNYDKLKTSPAMYHKPSDRYGDIKLHDDKDGSDIENWRHGPGTYNSIYQTGKTEGTWMANTDHMKNPTEPGYVAPPPTAEEIASIRGNDRWISNVEKIIGEGQDWKAWASAAGVNILNSRNDSNRIKKVFRDNNGKLPTT